jgi:hypothetical protein
MSASGTMLAAGRTATRITSGISTAWRLPSTRNVIGTRFTPNTVETSGASVLIGPPAAPVKIAWSAAACPSSARSSR